MAIDTSKNKRLLSLVITLFIGFVVASIVGHTNTDVFIVWVISAISHIYTFVTMPSPNVSIRSAALSVKGGHQSVMQATRDLFRERSYTIGSVGIGIITALALAIAGSDMWRDVAVNYAVALAMIYAVGWFITLGAISAAAKKL